LEHDWIEPLTYQSLALVAQRFTTELMWRIDVVAKKSTAAMRRESEQTKKRKGLFVFSFEKQKKVFAQERHIDAQSIASVSQQRK